MRVRTIPLVAASLLWVGACSGDDASNGEDAELTDEEVGSEEADEEGDDSFTIESDEGTLELGSSEDGDSITFESDEGSATLGGDLPDDFPLPVPDEYSVNASYVLDGMAGPVYSAVLEAAEEDFDSIDAMYVAFLDEEGFDVTRDLMESGTDKMIFVSATRDDAKVDITMSTEELAVVDEQVQRGTLISLTWTPTE